MKLRLKFALWTSLVAFIATPLTLVTLSIFGIEILSNVNVFKQLPEIIISPLTWKWVPFAFVLAFLIAPIAVKAENVGIIILIGLSLPILVAFFTLFILDIYPLNNLGIQTILKSLGLSYAMSIIILKMIVPSLLGFFSLIWFRILYYKSANNFT